MDVVSLCPLRVASLVWRPSSGGFALTVIGKATFELRPVELRLADQQEDPNEDDNFWDDDPHRSLRAPSDMAPFKPRADVVLVGQAFAPSKVPVRSLLARISVGAVDKTLEVHSDRVWTPEGGLREGAPFASMQLRYERAAHAPENPVGVRASGRGPLPNLQIPGGAPGPIGFGPIAPSWQARRNKLGRHAASFPPRNWREQLVPEDLDASFFNVAPEGQQTDRIEPAEVIVLENLHPQHPRLVTELPGARPRAFVDRGSGIEEVSLTGDTLWIDTDRAVCTVTWRGQIGLHGPSDEGRVTFLLDLPSRPLAWADIQRQCARRVQSQHPLDDAGTVVDEQALQGEGTRQYVMKSREPARGGPALPFVSNAAPEPLPATPRPQANTVPPWLEANTPAPTVSSLGGETLLPGALRVPSPSSPRTPVPPPMSLSSSSVLAAPSVLGVSNLAAVAPIVPVPEVVVPPPPPPEPRPPARSIAPVDVIDLIWFDPGTPDRVRVHPPWQELVAKARPVPPEPEPGEEPIEDPPEIVDRGDVFAAITDAEPMGLDEIDQQLAEATSPRGAFKPPLALVAGELEMTFEDLETLKATLAAAAPFAAGPDKKLKDAFDAASAALDTPLMQASARAVESLTSRLRDAFAQASTSLPAGWLDQQAERSLVEQRRYQKRSLLGETWIRALLGPRGAAVPTYLPEALAGKLPLYARFPARLVVQIHLQQDQYESHPAALRCLALARVVPPRATPRAPAKPAPR